MKAARTFLATAILCLSVSATPAAAQPIADAVVDIRSTRVVDRAPLEKFARSLRAHEDRLLRSEADRRAWDATTAEMSGPTGLARVQAIHARFNRIRYGADSRKDDWSAPAAFLARGHGDCEDYAMAKYRALRDLGVDASELGVIVYIDPAIRAVHAALLVNVEGRVYLLDNRRNAVVPADTVNFGRILYVVNERGTRLFVSPTRTQLASAAGRAR